jgi:hypothetical protein
MVCATALVANVAKIEKNAIAKIATFKSLMALSFCGHQWWPVYFFI